jgi:hypothetical protein
VITPTAPLLSTMMYSNVLMLHPVPDFAGNVPADGMGFKWLNRQPECARDSAYSGDVGDQLMP